MAKNDPIDASAPPEGGKKAAGKPTKKQIEESADRLACLTRELGL